MEAKNIHHEHVTEDAGMTTGGALLARLKAIGVDYIFANSGTDFPPIIEGLAEAEAKGIDLPSAIVVPHESAAMAMAYGYYLATGLTQAVMVHTNVGLANSAIGAINAANEHIPVLLFSGRTPATEKDRFGSRTVPIGWGQEMRDQAALVREACKWDYELRFPEQVSEIVDRAYAIANSLPRGPVYLSLPREVLCEICTVDDLSAPLRIQPAIPAPHPEALRQAAEALAGARRPVIIAQRGAGDAEGYAALSAMAEKWAIPVCQYWGLALAVASSHPMAAGSDPAELIAEADVILVIDALAPWSPEKHKPAPDCRVIHLGQDPLYSRIPVRNFRSDIALVADTSDGIVALAAMMDRLGIASGEHIEERRRLHTARNAETRRAAVDQARAGQAAPMTREWVGHCVSESIAGKNATVLSELACPLDSMDLAGHQAWFQEPHSGGLGWSFPAALGVQLADRDRLVVATVGDGSYMFANPVACHQVAEALELPVLLVIVNNAEWGAVRQSVLGIYPDGHAARANRMPLTGLSPIPDFTKVARASRAWARRVEDGGELKAAIREAIDHIETNRTMALLDVRVRS